MLSTIAIVGTGPRGLCTIERLLDALSNQDFDVPIKVLIFEGGNVGSGVHDVTQPSYLLMNTVCSQVTVFGRPRSRTRRPIGSPSLFEWARQKVQLIEEHDGTRRKVVETDYLPRRILGEYLSWAFGYVVRNAGCEISVTVHDDFVTSIARASCGSGYELQTERAARHFASNVILCTGHAPGGRTSNDSRALNGVISNPYPILDKIGVLPDGAEVGIEGFGLTAIDVLAAGSIGRGGAFRRDADGVLRYNASGRELRMSLFSRSGLPLSARATNQKPSGSSHQPQFLTDHYVDELRRRSARSDPASETAGIEFERDILPKVRLEFELSYYRTLLRNSLDLEAAELFAAAFVQGGADHAVARRFLDVVPAESRLSLDDLGQEAPEWALDHPESYRDWLLGRMRNDLAEAWKGNVDSPIKAACDVLRDLRPQMRRAIDAAGLSPASHAAFAERFVPFMNRLSVGPPASKIEELVALVEAGVADVSVGPLLSVHQDDQGHVAEGRVGRRHFRYLVRARIERSLAGEASLLGRLRDVGLARSFSNGTGVTGEIDVDQRHRVIASSGVVTPGLWAMGTPAEGSRFYTFVLPSPNAVTSPLLEAEQCVADVLRKVEQDLERRRPAHLVLAIARDQGRRPTAA